MYEINYISLRGFYSKPDSIINDIPILNDLWTVFGRIAVSNGKEILYPTVCNRCLNEMERAVHLPSKTCALVYLLVSLN